MRFPPSERVVYGRTSLVEVICQLKFTPVLKIDTDAPVAMQERLRGELPKYEKLELGQVTGGLALAGGQTMLIPPQVSDRRMEHTFLAADGRSKVVLGRDFVAHSTLSYERWEQFESMLDKALDAVAEAYAPHSFTRVGLRYQNVVRRGALELDAQPWASLLRPELIGMLAADPTLQPSGATREDTFDIDVLGRAGRARIIHGLVEHEGEHGYLIDSDFFVEGAHDRAASAATLDELHRQVRDFFRYCVLDTLHNAMKPEQIDGSRAGA